MKTAKQGAQTTLHCALDEQAGTETGLYYAECKPTTVHDRAKDEQAAVKLWQASWDMVQLGNYDPFQRQ
jgi:hypothetical protein